MPTIVETVFVSLEIYTLFKTKYFLKGGKLVKLLYRTMSQASSYNQSKYLLLALFVIISLICTNFFINKPFTYFSIFFF